jgi:hypothetical protein
VPAIEQHELDALETERKHINALAYLAQFTAPGTEFERAKLRLMESFVVKLGYTIMRMPQALLNQRTLACYSDNKQDGKHAHKLPDYNDIHCEYISTLDMPGLGSITSRCDTLEANFDPVVGSVKANWAMEFTGHGDETRWRNASVEIDLDGVTMGTHAEFDDDGIKSGGVSVGAGAGLGPKLEGGPLEIGVKAGVSAGLEFDRNGLSDVSISAGIESKTSSTIGKTDAAQSQSAMKAGANSTWSWNSGFSGAVSGGFDSSVF